MDFTYTKQYCDLLLDVENMLYCLSDKSTFDIIPSEDNVLDKFEELGHFHFGEVLRESKQDDDRKRALVFYQVYCKDARLCDRHHVVKSKEEAKCITKARTIEGLKKCLSTAIFDIDGVVDRLYQERCSDEADIVSYLKGCYALQCRLVYGAKQLNKMYEDMYDEVEKIKQKDEADNVMMQEHETKSGGVDSIIGHKSIKMPIMRKRGRPVIPFDKCLLGDEKFKEKVKGALHSLLDGKRGRDCALVIASAMKKGWITEPSFSTIISEFEVEGTRQGYGNYMEKVNGEFVKFDKIELEGMGGALDRAFGI